MLTGVGKRLREIRIDRNELLYDMAGKLSISVPDLSAFENGKKKGSGGFASESRPGI